MGKLTCKKCGYQMSNVACPNQYEGALIDDYDEEYMFDNGCNGSNRINIEDYERASIGIWECNCGAMAFDHPDRQEARKGKVKWYYPEDAKPGNYMKKSNRNNQDNEE